MLSIWDSHKSDKNTIQTFTDSSIDNITYRTKFISGKFIIKFQISLRLLFPDARFIISFEIELRLTETANLVTTYIPP